MDEKIMDEKTEDAVKSFIESVNNLFVDIELWVKDSPMKLSREEIQINEEASGTYKIQKLIIEDLAGEKIAEVTPISTFVLGANGRVDLNGTYDKAILIKLEKGGPTLTTTVTVGDHTKTSITSFYKGIEESGWYWVEDSRRGRAHLIDQKLFFELLEEVSDYGLE